jgi:hypothetical protein
VQVNRTLLIVVLVAATLAVLRLAWVAREYVTAIDTLQQVQFTVLDAERSGPEQLVLTVRIHNGSSGWVDVQALHLNVYARGSRSAGATYEAFAPLRVGPHSTEQVTRTVTLVRPADVSDPPETLRFRGQALLRLPVSERYFAEPLDLTWEEQ